MTSNCRVSVSIRIGRYRGPGSEEDYRRAKLARIVGDGAPQEEWHDRFIADGGDTLPLADPALEDSYTAAARTVLGIRKGCALGTLSGYNLLTDGETLESAHFSLLTADVGDHPAGTAVYVQRTGLADTYFLLPGVRVTAGGRVVTTPVFAAVPAQPPLLRADSEWVSVATDAASSMVEELVKQQLEAKLAGYLVSGLSTLAGGIAGGILGAILGGVVDLIFSSDDEDYLKDLEEMFQKIVEQTVRQNTVDQISSAISQVNTNIAVEYIAKRKEFMGLTGAADTDPQVQKLDNRKLLFDLLKGYEDIQSQNGGIEYLMREDVAKAALPVFMLGVTQKLALYQEMAMVDPTGPRDPVSGLFDPTKSGYVTDSIPAAVRKYAAHIEKTWPLIKTDRENKVEFPTVVRSYNRYVSGDVQVITICGLEDKYDGTKIEMGDVSYSEKDGYQYSDAAKTRAAEYKAKKVAELATSLSDPDAFILRLKELEKSPMGRVVITE